MGDVTVGVMGGVVVTVVLPGGVMDGGGVRVVTGVDVGAAGIGLEIIPLTTTTTTITTAAAATTTVTIIEMINARNLLAIILDLHALVVEWYLLIYTSLRPKYYILGRDSSGSRQVVSRLAKSMLV
jgi:hypothetical protein